ncbi:sulfatase-like hydrolase/transferase, partial [Planctomycetota bacterium]
MERPNVLMIMADQLPAAALGAYGHPLVRSPSIDALAAEGVRFDHCICNSPLCAPSRASMVTGLLPCRTGVFDSGCELPAQVPTVMHHLRRAGYRTILSGKMHFVGPDQLHGFDERLTTDIYPSFFHWTPNWRKGVYPNPGTSVVGLKDAGRCRWNMQLDYDEEVHFRALERLRAIARDRADRRPFFLCVSYTHPHDPFIVPRKYWDLYDHDAIDVPAARPQPMARMHAFNRWLQVHHEIDRYPPSEELIRRARHAFYGMI